jgi:predicted outer membrane repeat protein
VVPAPCSRQLTKIESGTALVIQGDYTHQELGSVGFQVNGKLVLRFVTVDGGETQSTSFIIAAAMSTVVVQHCHFDSFVSDGDGPVINAFGATVLVERSKFSNSHAENGGSISVFGTRLTVYESEFSSNAAKESGGAIFVKGILGAVIISGTTFDSCSATTGGAIYIVDAQEMIRKSASTYKYTFTANNQRAVLTGCTYRHCKAEISGGALRVDLAPVAVDTSIFAGNEARQGGAVAVKDADLQLNTSTFVQNLAYLRESLLYASEVSEGGGLHVLDSIADINGATFNMNSAQGGEGDSIFASVSTMRVWETDVIPFDAVGSVYTAVVPLAGCTDLVPPCAPGYSCSYERFSIFCRPCESGLVSLEGLVCTTCAQAYGRAGLGPNPDQTGCVSCQGNNYSSFGICLECPPALVVAKDRSRCEDCGARRTAFAESDGAKRICGCQQGFYNSTEALRVCFHSGYDESKIQNALSNTDMLKGQECLPCPTDVTGDGCLTCSAGVAVVSPGFTVPPISSSAAARRALQDERAPNNVATLFRCHIELDLAIARCPGCESEPCACAVGYSGNVCNECDENYGMSSSTRTCEPCEGTGYTAESMFLLAGIVFGTILVFFILGKIWKNFPLKHLLRCVFQPVRFTLTLVTC